jgi:GNAT superfamily N-acetyltransferase
MSTTEVNFRDEPRPADVRAIRGIVESTGFFQRFEIDVAAELIEERLARGPASGYHFLFADERSGGRTVGYACYGPIACTVGSFDLYWIAVDRERQGGGLGRRILAETEFRISAADGRRVYIETSGQPKYRPTREFYLRCGYLEEARLQGFYAEGDDKLVYAKTLVQGPA